MNNPAPKTKWFDGEIGVVNTPSVIAFALFTDDEEVSTIDLSDDAAVEA